MVKGIDAEKQGEEERGRHAPARSDHSSFAAILPIIIAMTDAATISQYTQANLAADVSMKVAVKARDVARQQGASVLSLLETAANLSKSMAVEPGKGGQLDVVG